MSAGVAVDATARLPLVVQTDLATVLDFLARLVEALVWPVFLLLVLDILVDEFEEELSTLFGNISEWTLKIGPAELSGKQLDNVLEAAATLGNVAADKKSEGSRSDREEAREISRALTTAIRQRRLTFDFEQSILWVDDAPERIEAERRAFEELEFTVTHVESTEQALERLGEVEYDLVISDFSRGDDDRAAFTLLDRMRDEKIATPLVIYTFRDTPGAESRPNPVFGVARSPRELLDLVLRAT